MGFGTSATSGGDGNAVSAFVTEALAAKASDWFLLRFLWDYTFVENVRTFAENFVC
jgi:hypothetical protein